MGHQDLNFNGSCSVIEQYVMTRSARGEMGHQNMTFRGI